MSHRSLSGAAVGSLTLATLLIVACASVGASEPPAASPASAAALPAVAALPIANPPAVVAAASGSVVQPEQASANARDRSHAMGEGAATKSLKSLDAPAAPFIFAERRASEALDQLASFVNIRHEKRGSVITLPCDRLVEPGQWAITVGGRFRLAELAPGLRDQDGHAISIQAYTDSQGTSAVNDALSLRRAEAVRDYLTTQGVAAESMRAEGLGARRPVAGNATPDGRAQNRRIEIVIAP